MKRAMLLNLAVLTRELRTRMRGRRAAVVITVDLLLLSAIGGWMIYTQHQDLRSGFNASAASTMGLQIFATLYMFQLFLVIFIVPGLTLTGVCKVLKWFENLESARESGILVAVTKPDAGGLPCAFPANATR